MNSQDVINFAHKRLSTHHHPRKKILQQSHNNTDIATSVIDLQKVHEERKQSMPIYVAHGRSIIVQFF